MQPKSKPCPCSDVPDNAKERIRRDFRYPVPMQYWEASAVLHELNLLRQKQHLRGNTYEQIIDLLALPQLVDPALSSRLNIRDPGI